ncbi:MAG: heavy metal translocating P-type ATPase metal-binding domain-containing protein [Ignavibacteria bacterium]|nr:heavy metal translocating P-type ATPase metal-binding domain-containing protein [Ignavibacteria bacterium]MBT8381283.1 heavy metal translocating P-type ATPase metal-binding domain-containing protein [Ignavibacteria bacterium]MBT8390687.1 heavy metal translocating P-type ATPase metal-binding domain-containing protein [Ignavibacteria bacterium]NNJ51714.1 HAD-IC family P-type ATPase [Ignavibacteriaceae bacterium]NNL20705.1 HAD-IC family P-type ATPase [Ignavibacteriaceae bacterium]
MSAQHKIEKSLTCYHCGDECNDDSIKIDEKLFCCNGCKTVYEILDQNKLCEYYNLEETPGISPPFSFGNRFDYLDDDLTVRQLLDFQDENLSKITFHIPQMHCSSCIWLLENLYKLNRAVSQSNADFLKKKVSITFSHNNITLKEIVKLLASIGYEPQILLESVDKKDEDKTSQKLYYRLGVAGFCFANVMLLTFPEYLGIDVSDAYLKKFFIYLNLILSLPVVFFSGWEYFGSAIKGLRKNIINIDFPISLGILALFGRSIYEIAAQTGSGYFDSLTGLIFFLLIGKLLQDKTYSYLNFERNYKSFFPLSVTINKDTEEKSIPLSKLMVGNRIVVRKNEIIPADSILFNGDGKIDYSFVTGESKPVDKVSGELIYAGGKQLGSAIELEVINDVSQSYLTQLWNNEIFNKKTESYFTNFSNAVSKYFTFVILLIAFVSAGFWFQTSAAVALNVFTAVLIVACPCALALSTPFTLGNAMRILGRNKLFLRNTLIIEELAKVDQIVFDKTGTITKLGKSDIIFSGEVLNPVQQKMIKSLVRNSTHPLSKIIFKSLDVDEFFPVTKFDEQAGFGISGVVYGNKLKVGSKDFIVSSAGKINLKTDDENNYSTKIYVSISDEVLGYFTAANSYRKGIGDVIKSLGKRYNLSLLSGDKEGERVNLLKFFSNNDELLFNQSPEQKLIFIKEKQNENKIVLMFGDGLNDAGALKQSDVGIAVTEDIGNFSPASDAILDASKLVQVPKFLTYAKSAIRIIYISFVISFLYNLIGLSFAIQGILSPIVAALLMPFSSISVVLFATLSTNFMAKKLSLIKTESVCQNQLKEKSEERKEIPSQ